MSVPCRLFVVLLLLGGPVAIVPLAHATPTDPLWIAGVYDGGDADDLVWAVTSTDSTLDYGPTEIVRPFPSLLGLFPPFGTTLTALATALAFQTRAPPAS